MTLRLLISSKSYKQLQNERNYAILFKFLSNKNLEVLPCNKRFYSKILTDSSISKKLIVSSRNKGLNLNQINSRLESTKSKTDQKTFSFLSWKSLFVCTIFGAGVYLFMIKLQREKDESIRRQRKQAIGKMAIGGPFELVDHNGKLRKNTDFLGQWNLIYFGFTHCPDICPEEMEKMVRVVDLIEKVQIKGSSIQPIFITVDPDRDDVKAVGNYIKDFSSKIIGLTGNKQQIEQVTRAYRVYFSLGPKDEDKDYIVDHTVIMYLIDPEGNFVDYFGQNKTAEEIATAVAIQMGTFKFKQNEKDDGNKK